VFCNINEKCISIKDKCENIEKVDENVTKGNLKLVDDANANSNAKELDSKISLTNENLSQMISDKVKKQMVRAGILNEIRKKQMHRYTNKKYNIGLLIGEEKNIVTTPYTELRNLILNYPDIVKRQTFIIDFIKVYTRIPTNDEDKWWLYCVTTNTKLLPTFIQKLAVAFIQGWDSYNKEMQTICKIQGTLSDDGDSWVDKYSGFFIKKVDFDTEEGYTEEGFKVKSRDILEQDAGSSLNIEVEEKNDVDEKEDEYYKNSYLSAISNLKNNNKNVLENTGIVLSDIVSSAIVGEGNTNKSVLDVDVDVGSDEEKRFSSVNVNTKQPSEIA
jgi:hypothetical protein